MKSLTIGIIIAIVLLLTISISGAVVLKSKSDQNASNTNGNVGTPGGSNGRLNNGSGNGSNGGIGNGSGNGSNGGIGNGSGNGGIGNGSNSGSNNGSTDEVFACEYTDWSDWSDCTTDDCRSNPNDPSGVTFRTREVSPNSLGTNCTDVTETVECNTEMCPRNCTYTNWGPWTRCDKECGDGTQTRTRSIDTAAQYGGECTNDVVESRPCIITPCPADCTVSDWSDWSPCDEPCGDGNQFRTRTVDTPALYGGAECPALREDASCKVKDCPVDCVVGAWSEWSDCDVDCGSGQQMRTRDIIVGPNADGVACPHVVEYRNCVMPPCPIDCVMGEWSEWSPCDVECGDGTQTRTRTVLSPPENGGAECSSVVSETRACYQPPCPIDCTKTMGEWSPCNGCDGESTRSEIMQAPALYGGVCDLKTETKKCNTDCTWSKLSTNRTVTDQTKSIGKYSTHVISSLNACKNKCLNTPGCDLVDYRSGGLYRSYPCMLYKYPKGTTYRDGITLYRLS